MVHRYVLYIVFGLLAAGEFMLSVLNITLSLNYGIHKDYSWKLIRYIQTADIQGCIKEREWPALTCKNLKYLLYVEVASSCICFLATLYIIIRVICGGLKLCDKWAWISFSTATVVVDVFCGSVILHDYLSHKKSYILWLGLMWLRFGVLIIAKFLGALIIHMMLKQQNLEGLPTQYDDWYRRSQSSVGSTATQVPMVDSPEKDKKPQFKNLPCYDPQSVDKSSETTSLSENPSSIFSDDFYKSLEKDMHADDKVTVGQPQNHHAQQLKKFPIEDDEEKGNTLHIIDSSDVHDSYIEEPKHALDHQSEISSQQHQELVGHSEFSYINEEPNISWSSNHNAAYEEDFDVPRHQQDPSNLQINRQRDQDLAGHSEFSQLGNSWDGCHNAAFTEDFDSSRHHHDQSDMGRQHHDQSDMGRQHQERSFNMNKQNSRQFASDEWYSADDATRHTPSRNLAYEQYDSYVQHRHHHSKIGKSESFTGRDSFRWEAAKRRGSDNIHMPQAWLPPHRISSLQSLNGSQVSEHRSAREMEKMPTIRPHIPEVDYNTVNSTTLWNKKYDSRPFSYLTQFRPDDILDIRKHLKKTKLKENVVPGNSESSRDEPARTTYGTIV